MIDDLLIFLILFGFQYIAVMWIGFCYRRRNSESADREMSVTVIVPFRNEFNRISGLLSSIDKLVIPENVSVELFFVDDHTADDTNQLISSKLRFNHQIIKNDGKGKKEAIKTAVSKSNSEFILTWDADITVPENYFEELSKLPEADMVILPVKMNGSNFLSRLVTVDFSWLQMMAYALANWGIPFLNNGANLLFKKDAFLEADEYRTDYKMLSGDDVYLLNKLKELGKNIIASNSISLRVETMAPTNMRDIKNQRKRWLSKVSENMDLKSVVLTVFLSLMVLGGLGCLLMVIAYREIVFLFPIGLKMFNEYLFLRFYKGFKDILVDIPVVLAHQFFFPIYLFYVIVNPVKYDARWGH